jgi:hypothetical protein
VALKRPRRGTAPVLALWTVKSPTENGWALGKWWTAALIEPPPGSLAADESIRQEWDGQRVCARDWFPTESSKIFLREMKHVSDVHERVLSLLILPEAEAPWEREEDEDD